MTDKIEVKYDEMDQISGRFDNQAGEIQQMMQNVRAKMEDLHNGGWIGRGSDSFFAEMQGEVLPAVTRLQQALEQASHVARQINDTMKQAEEEACTPFKIRGI